MFGPEDAFWCNGKEIAHFHGADVVELRLTKAVIRELRPLLRADDRVTLRKGTSDWIEVRVVATWRHRLRRRPRGARRGRPPRERRGDGEATSYRLGARASPPVPLRDGPLNCGAACAGGLRR